MISARFGVEGDEAVEKALKKIEDGSRAAAQGFKEAGDAGTASADQITRALKTVEEGERQLAAAFKDALESGRTTADQMRTALEDLGGKAGAASGQIGDAARRANSALGELNLGAVTAGSTIGNVLGEAVTRAAGAIVDLGKSVFAAYGQMKDLAEQTGLTIAQIQAWRQVVAKSGEDVDILNRVMVVASRNIGLVAEGNQRLTAVLDRLGVGVLRADGSLRDFNGIVRDIIDAMARLDDQATRNALGAQFFGTGWIKLADAFKDGVKDVDAATDALVRHRALIDEGAREKIEALTKVVNSSSEAWKGLALNIVAGASPALIQVAKDAEGATTSFSKFLEVVSKWGGGLPSLSGVLGFQFGLSLTSPQYGPPTPTGSQASPRTREAQLEAELVASLKHHGGETIDSARIRAALNKVRDEILRVASDEVSEALSVHFYDNSPGTSRGYFNPGKSEPYGPPLPPGWGKRGGGGGGSVDQTAKEYERAKEALDKYLDSLARESDLSDESARERAGHVAELKAEELARAKVLRMTEDQIQAVGEEAKARALAAYDSKKAQEDQRRASEQAQREMERMAEREAQLLQQPAEQAIRNVYSLTTDIFKDAMSGNLDSWEDFWKRAKDIGRQYLAELATLLVIRPLIQPLISVAGLGGLVPGGMGGGAAGGVGGGIGSIGAGVPYPSAGASLGGGGLLGGMPGGGLFGGSGDLFGLGGFLRTPLFGGSLGSVASFEGVIPGMTGAEAYNYISGLPGQSAGLTVGGALAGIGSIGLGAYSLSQGNTIGGISGILGGGLGLLGAAVPALGFLGPVGMGIGLIGGLLGGLLGKKPKTPQEVTNISFAGGAMSSAMAMSRGRSLGTTGQAASGFTDAFGELLSGYGLSLGPGAIGGYILNSVGKNTGNQFIVGLGDYNRDPRESRAGLRSPEEAIGVLAGLLLRENARGGTLGGAGFTPTVSQIVQNTDLDSLDAIKAALDFAPVFDDLQKGTQNVTAMDRALRELDKQYDAVAAQTRQYGLDVGLVEKRRQEAIAQLAIDANADYRRREIGLTPGGQLRLALEDNAKGREQALKEAATLNAVSGVLVDINQIERTFAAERKAIIDQALGTTLQDLARGTDTITAAELAVRGLNQQFDNLAGLAEAAGGNVGLVRIRAQEAINKLATDVNADYRRRSLLMTPEGQLQVALEDLEVERKAAIANAQYLNQTVTGALADIDQIEAYYAARRVRIVEDSNAAMAQSMQGLRDVYNNILYGSLSGVSPGAAASGSQATYMATLAQARGGDRTALQRLGSDASAYITALAGAYGHGERFGAGREQVLADLASFLGTQPANTAGGGNADLSEAARVIAQQSELIDQLTAQVEVLTDQMALFLAQQRRS
ncbi:hypothetical protein FHP25_25020 [Vineibacter terrae]|uniref:Bacteriophage tail tape measure N-terminal domain-containing protein n=1 Tax=Vineibacter terrae TaxID=2586908 RepID=A0A5C8PH94_9HYPH|nr:hypothetical protein [Vineibacter terrae]TXL72561.1 hypothetical protein FHP25_25020 [Vineibacter terrae]